MTHTHPDLCALLAAARDAPDDPGLRAAMEDWCRDNPGHSDWAQAVAEFGEKCREKRRYRTEVEFPRTDYGYIERRTVRRALPGWREWLAEPGNLWFRVDAARAVNLMYEHSYPSAVNFPRLVPTLFAALAGADRWWRTGARVELLVFDHDNIMRTEGIQHEFRVTLTFGGGWVTHALFRDWQSADALLPLVLADQPFAEAGIRGAIRLDRGYGYLDSDVVGPAWLLVKDYRGPWMSVGEDEARAALSAALRARVRVREVT